VDSNLHLSFQLRFFQRFGYHLLSSLAQALAVATAIG
jgi:hypothetical protein